MKHYTNQELKNRFVNAAHDCCEWNKKRSVVVDELTALMAMNEYPDAEAFFIVDWALDSDKNLKTFRPIFLARERGVLVDAIRERCEKKMEVTK